MSPTGSNRSSKTRASDHTVILRTLSAIALGIASDGARFRRSHDPDGPPGRAKSPTTGPSYCKDGIADVRLLPITGPSPGNPIGSFQMSTAVLPRPLTGPSLAKQSTSHACAPGASRPHRQVRPRPVPIGCPAAPSAIDLGPGRGRGGVRHVERGDDGRVALEELVREHPVSRPRAPRERRHPAVAEGEGGEWTPCARRLKEHLVGELDRDVDNLVGG